MVDLPARIGPAEFSVLGGRIAIRCPHDLDDPMRRAGRRWEPETRQWLIERRRMGPVIRNLRRDPDPLLSARGHRY